MENTKVPKEYTVGELMDYLSTKNREQKVEILIMSDCFKESDSKMSSSLYSTEKFILAEFKSDKYNKEKEEFENENIIVLYKQFSTDKNFACIKLNQLDEETKKKINKDI